MTTKKLSWFPTWPAFLLSFFYLLMPWSAEASPITYTDTFDSSTNTWTYALSVTNDTATPLFDVTLLSLPVVPTGAATPSQWFSSLGTNFVDWEANFGYEIAPATTLSGFNFTYIGSATDSIGSLSWQMLDTNFNQLSGDTVAASSATGSVPEPPTVLLFLGGLLSGYACWRRSNKVNLSKIGFRARSKMRVGVYYIAE